MFFYTCYIVLIINIFSTEAKSVITPVPQAIVQGTQMKLPIASAQNAPLFTPPTIPQTISTATLSSTISLFTQPAPINNPTASVATVAIPTPILAPAPVIMAIPKPANIKTPQTSAPKTITVAIPAPLPSQLIVSSLPITRINAIELFKQWKKLLKGSATFIEIAQFIEQHPTFPKQTVLREKAENAMLDPAADRIAIDQAVEFFDRYPPQTSKGQFYYAKALLGQGKIDQAKQEFYKLLVSFVIPPDIVKQLSTYKDYLPFLWTYLHASNLLYTEKRDNASAMLPYLSPTEKERIQLRLDLLNKKTDAPNRALKLIGKPGNNDAIVFELIRYYRRLKTKEADETALQLFKTHTFLDEEQHASVFWKERNLFARRMLDAGRPLDAYKLVKNHGFKTHKATHPGEILCNEECAHAHCMNGWIALKHANKPAKALSIFQHIETIVKEPISKARAMYWIGEAYLQLQQLSESKKAFLEASTYSTTFYGQMAASKIDDPLFKNQYPTVKSIAFKAVLNVVITPAEKQAFENLELVQAIRSAPEATRIHNCDSFFFALLKISQKLEFQRQVFDLAENVKSRAYAVLLAKKKHMTFKVAYPLLNPETRRKSINLIAPKSPFGSILLPLAHAIIRRESGFDESAKSGANAQGMMQLIPATAQKEVKALKRFGIHFSTAINLYEKIKNITLGTSHIEGLMTTYKGSLILSLAAYNAGPKPIDEWVQTYGDPRDPKIDIVNWIESIPYAETRNYVQRVLENFMVYMQFLSEEAGIPNGRTLLSYLRAG